MEPTILVCVINSFASYNQFTHCLQSELFFWCKKMTTVLFIIPSKNQGSQFRKVKAWLYKTIKKNPASFIESGIIQNWQLEASYLENRSFQQIGFSSLKQEKLPTYSNLYTQGKSHIPQTTKLDAPIFDALHKQSSFFSHLFALSGFSLDNKTTASAISVQPMLQQNTEFTQASFQLSRALTKASLHPFYNSFQSFWGQKPK